MVRCGVLLWLGGGLWCWPFGPRRRTGRVASPGCRRRDNHRSTAVFEAPAKNSCARACRARSAVWQAVQVSRAYLLRRLERVASRSGVPAAPDDLAANRVRSRSAFRRAVVPILGLPPGAPGTRTKPAQCPATTASASAIHSAALYTHRRTASTATNMRWSMRQASNASAAALDSSSIGVKAAPHSSRFPSTVR